MDYLLHEFQSKKVGLVGDASPLSKKVGDAVLPRPLATTPVCIAITRAITL